jgi:hypothetical protein
MDSKMYLLRDEENGEVIGVLKKDDVEPRVIHALTDHFDTDIFWKNIKGFQLPQNGWETREFKVSVSDDTYIISIEPVYTY